MVLALVRLLFLVAAGFAMLRIWRWIATGDSTQRRLVAVGFIARAFLSLILFWISWLSLPIGRSLQTGRGLWFFALDAQLYTKFASDAAHQGLTTIATLPKSVPSVTYVQALSLFSALFGDVVAVSLLLNLVCFLGMCAILVRWSAAVPGSRKASLVALAAVCLSPAGTLWSLQPLKDTFMQFLMVGFVAACFLWQRAWRGTVDGRYLIAGAAGLLVTHYLASGVRWYFGLVLLGLATLFLFVTSLLSRNRVAAALLSFALLLLITRAFVSVTHPYLPMPIRGLFGMPGGGAEEVESVSAALTTYVDRARAGFERSGGNTSIRPGTAIDPNAPLQRPVPSAPVAVTTPVSTPASKPVSKPAPQPAPVAPTPAPAPTPTTQPVQVKPVAPPPTAVAVQRPQPQPAVQKTAEEGGDDSDAMTGTRAERFVAGAVATALPRAIASRLNLVRIGGARSFWWFVDADTLVFDAVLFIAIASVIAHYRRGTYRNAVFWVVVGMTLLLGTALVYTVSNFGTLFRLRMMIYTGIALVPLALMAMPAPEPRVAEEGVPAALSETEA